MIARLAYSYLPMAIGCQISPKAKYQSGKEQQDISGDGNTRKVVSVFLVVLSLLVVAPHFRIPSVAGASYTFTDPQLVDLIQGQDDSPSTLRASNGTLWIAWQHWFDFGYFVTYSASRGWSNLQNLTMITGSAFMITPGLGQLTNSSIILVWSSNQTGRWNLYYKLYSYNNWQRTVQLTSGTSFNDFNPRITVGSNSTLWVFWQRNLTTSNSTLIYYKTLKGNFWSSDTQLTPPPPPNGTGDTGPTPTTTYDGKIWVTWSRLAPARTSNIYYRSYDGKAWSSETLLTNNSTLDTSAAIAQDRNGTIWDVWSRQMFLGIDPTCNCAVYQQKLFYKTSYDGSTWSRDTQLTSYGNLTMPLDDDGPSVIQGADKNLYIFYSSDYPIGSDFKIFYIKTGSITPVTNVVITGVQSGAYAFQNNVAVVQVTVSNVGDFAQTILVTVKAANATSYTIASSVAESLLAGSTVTFTFVWNTTAIPLGRYTITVSYPRLSGQSLLASGGDQMQYRYLTIISSVKRPVCHMLRNCPV